jgi:hypothetical protein
MQENRPSGILRSKDRVVQKDTLDTPILWKDSLSPPLDTSFPLGCGGNTPPAIKANRGLTSLLVVPQATLS